MGKNFIMFILTVGAFGFALVPRSTAGTEMLIDNSAQTQTYNYAPPPLRPPPVVYYAPPPVRVVVYPRIGYYAPRYRVHGYDRWHARRGYHRPHPGL